VKRTEMPPRTVPLPRSTIGRNQGPKTPAKRRPKDTGPDKVTSIAVLERDEWACVKCGTGAHGQRGLDYSIHHRRLRAQGVDNGLPNLVTLCGDGVRGCHGWAHHNRSAAEAEGLIVRSGFDLLQAPIFHHAYGQIFLLATGLWSTRPATNETA
jgi:hypothetical protein